MSGADPRVGAIWLGAAVVLASGLWLHAWGGTGAFGLPARPAGSSELRQELEWVDRRLAAERAAGAADDPLRACRVASLHWDRAERLAQHEFYDRFGLPWETGHDQEYSPFREQCLRRDASGDVAAALAAARRALELAPPGSGRIRALWYYSMGCATRQRYGEEIGALVEVAHTRPHQAWVWRMLAQAYRSHGDQGRQELAEEQAWLVATGRPLSHYIALAVAHTPYAPPAPRP